MERIRATGMESAYGRKRVLKGVDLSAMAGECIGIIGANGCGKSTLLSILAGLRRADKGCIAFEGQIAFDGNATGSPLQRKQQKELFIRYTGYVPQESTLIPELTVWDNLLLWYWDKAALTKQLQDGALHKLGLADMLSLKVNRLSGGMKKRVSIACALAGQPQILLLDEPGAALDLPGKNELRQYLNEYKADGGTILLATHEEKDLDICDKIYLLQNGESRIVDSNLRGEALMAQIMK